MTAPSDPADPADPADSADSTDPADPIGPADLAAPTRRLLVSGRVQGVGFRWYTREAAVELGLSGWVRNLHDGRVEVLARGPAASLEALAERLRNGPGRVERVEASERRDEPLPAVFEIRRSG